MKRYLTQLMVGCILVATGLGATLKELEKSYLVRYHSINGQRDQQLEVLRASYLGALSAEMDKVKASGKLERVIPFRDEIEVIKAGKDPLPALPEGSPYSLTGMRAKYSGAHQKLLKKHATELTDLSEKMENLLQKREAELTRAGEIDEALVAKKMRETLTGTDEIEAAETFLRFTGNGVPTPVAARLRRFGDNIEVLVRYDEKGKISMSSPIENVREDGGGKLDTKATVLGEFVGAEGYEVDPYVAYEAVLDGRDLPNMAIGEFEYKTGFEVKGRKGVRLTLVANAANPHISFGPILPPIKSKGSYRLTCSYLVPEGNKVVSGIRFVHGVGGLIGGQAYSEVGEWSIATAAGESPNEFDRLIFYFDLKTGKKVSDAGKEYVMLSGLKVEHVKFSAYLCAKHSDDGLVSEEFDSVEEQPLFITNGELLAN